MRFIVSLIITVAQMGLCNWGNAEDRPNVIVIMTDDQGIGDFGCMGNSLVETPNVDAMFRQSVYFSNFYVHPVCTPTRACLMTGRYNYRTRAIDTFVGRAMMDTEEVTIAERLKAAGYATGIFGKWHLGDCYPMRAMDQGFDYSVVHRGGGIGQSSDPPGAEAAYTNPILFHNGQPRRENGYCTDVYYEHAIGFIQECKSRELPFLVYLADNCPHGPFKDVPREWWEKYKDVDLTHDKYPQVNGGNPVNENTNKDKNARVYAMVSNIDENIGRLQEELKRLELYENTIVIFLTDNGPNGARYVKGLRGQKTSVYEGGIKTMCLMQWPARIREHRKVEQLAAHIDLHPTILGACGIPVDVESPKLDGVSLMPLVNGQQVDWEKTRKPLFIQTHRGNAPQRFHHFAVRDHRWKLVHHSGFHNEGTERRDYELFDIVNDPFEKDNVVDQEPDIAARLLEQYSRWFNDVSQTRDDNYACPRIVIDPTKENPVVLTRQDVRRVEGQKGWGRAIRWMMAASMELELTFACRFKNAEIVGPVTLEIDQQRYQTEIDPETKLIQFEEIPVSPGEFEIRVTAKNNKEEIVAAHQVYISSQIVTNK